MRARWAEPRVPLRKPRTACSNFTSSGRGGAEEGRGGEREEELADTLHKQLSIAGTEFPLWCFEVMNTDAVEASGLDGSWLKIVSLSLCLLDFTVQCSAVRDMHL